MKALDALQSCPAASPHVTKCREAMKAGDIQGAVEQALRAGAEGSRQVFRDAGAESGKRPKRLDGVLTFVRDALRGLDQRPTVGEVYGWLPDEETYYPNAGARWVWRNAGRVYQRDSAEQRIPRSRSKRTLATYIKDVWVELEAERVKPKPKKRVRPLPAYRHDIIEIGFGGKTWSPDI